MVHENGFFHAERAHVHTLVLSVPLRIGGGWGQAGAQARFRLSPIVAENAVRVHVSGDISVPWGGTLSVRLNGHDIELCMPTRVPLFEENVIDVQIVHPVPLYWIGEQLVVLTVEIEYIATEEEHEEAVEETRRLNEPPSGDAVIVPEQPPQQPSPFPFLPGGLQGVFALVVLILFLVLMIKIIGLVRR